MFLHRIHLDSRCREARRDLSDPYQLHSTLCRAFSSKDRKCLEGAFLWRLEPETGVGSYPRVLIQSRGLPNWDGIGVDRWLAKADPPIDLFARLSLDALAPGRRFRFRLRANPCVTRNGKRLGLLQTTEQEKWIQQQGQRFGFCLPTLAFKGVSGDDDERPAILVSDERMLRGRQRSGNSISVFSVLYDGVLVVTEPAALIRAVEAGIGHAKAMGLGLLSLASVS